MIYFHENASNYYLKNVDRNILLEVVPVKLLLAVIENMETSPAHDSIGRLFTH